MLPSLHRLALRHPTGAENDAPQNLDDVETDLEDAETDIDEEERVYQVSVWHERSDAAYEPANVAELIPASYGPCRMEVRLVTAANPSPPGLDTVTSADELRDRFKDSWDDMELPHQWVDGRWVYDGDVQFAYHRSWVVRLSLSSDDETPWTGTIDDRDYSRDPGDGKQLILGWMRDAMRGLEPFPSPRYPYLDEHTFPAGQEVVSGGGSSQGSSN